MYVKTNSPTLTAKASRVTSVFATLQGGTLSQVVKGRSQPPRKSVDISADIVTIAAYSAMKNIENFIEEYSVWYPATSSDSASGMSKGSRFVSAKAATTKTNQASVSVTTFHTP